MYGLRDVGVTPDESLVLHFICQFGCLGASWGVDIAGVPGGLKKKSKLPSYSKLLPF